MNKTKDNLDALSNAELRTLLVQYGFPVQPVTATTRNVLISRLRNRMKQEKDKLRKESSYVTRYSSGEESDLDNNRTARGTRSFGSTGTSSINYYQPTIQRKNYSLSTSVTTTTGYNNMPPPLMTTSKQKRNPTIMTSSSTSLPIIKVPIQSRNSVYIPPPIIATDTDEDSDVNSQNDYSKSTSSYSSISARLSGYTFPQRYSPSTEMLDTSNKRHLSASSSSLRSRYPVAGDISPEKHQQQHYETTPNSNGHNSTEDSPYLSEFTKRLLKLRGETVGKESAAAAVAAANNARRTDRFLSNRYYKTNTSDASIVADNEIVHHADSQQDQSSSSLAGTTGVSINAAFSKFFNKLDEQYGVKQTLVPCILVTILVLFLTLVVFMYLTISPDLVNTLNPQDTTYNICKPGTTALANSGYSCINADELDSALNLLKIIAPVLQKRVENNRCKDATIPFMMTAKEVIHYIINHDPNLHVPDALRALHNMEYLIQSNPKWRINHVSEDGSILSFDDVVKRRSTQTNSFGILNPRLPFSCLIYYKLQKFFLIVGTIGLAVILFYVINNGIKLFVRIKQSRKDKVNGLINDIINVLMEQAIKEPGNPDAGLIVISHLRDKFIPPQERRESEWAWNEAIKFLEQNESRIQFEVGNRNGEDCKLMRWVDTTPMTTSTITASSIIGSFYQRSSATNNIKKWQSPAFDKLNKIKEPPTQCLKIRQMFDKYEANNPNLKQIITDAILEKVGPECKIYDVQLEKTTCCVYVRCATDKDAGIVHDEINGWWFDNRLVSIKFLRLHRYLDRFPKSLSGPTVLRPSNSKKLSMTQCYMDQADNDLDDDDDDDDDDDMVADD